MRTILLTMAVFVCGCTLSIAGSDVSRSDLAKIKAHPRLMFNTSHLVDDTSKGWSSQIITTADELCSKAAADHKGNNSLGYSRSLLNRVQILGYAARITGDKKYSERAWDEMQKASELAHWNPGEFLQVSTMTVAHAIAYDWLHDKLDESQKALLASAIKDKGLEHGITNYEAKVKPQEGKVYNRWTVAETNWNLVCNTAMSLGALAIAENDPKYAQEVLNHALSSVEYGLESYAPDGGWFEGPDYWTYGTGYLTMMIASLESALGDDYGLLDKPGLQETPNYLMHMFGPTGLAFNYSDGGFRIGSQTVAPMMYFSGTTQSQIHYNFAVRHAQKPPVTGLLFYKPQTAKTSLPTLGYFENAQVVSIRSDWTDEASFIAIKGGTAWCSHGHAETGTFVLDAFGQRFVHELGLDQYGLDGYGDFEGKRWDYYRVRSEGNNTLTIAPDRTPGQDIKALSEFTTHGQDDTSQYAVLDMTPAYSQHANSVKRAVRVFNNGDILMQDEFSMKSEDGTPLHWFAHTEAQLKIANDGKSVQMVKGGQTLEAIILFPVTASFAKSTATPLSTSPSPSGQNANSRFSKLSIAIPNAKNGAIAIWFKSGNGSKKPALLASSKWAMR